MGLKTTHKVLINNQDIFAKLESKEISITITDERGFASDRAEIVINNAKNISVPSSDAEMAIYINDTLMGRYKVTSISLSSRDGYTLTIQASGVDFKNKFKTKNTRSFTKEKENNKISDVVETIASANGYKSVISNSLKNQQLDDTVQSETDLKFLTRIAKQFNATVKANNNTIMFIERTKHNIPSKQLQNSRIVSFELQANSLYNFKSVSAYYTNLKTGGTLKTQVGNQEPIFTLDRIYKSKDMAQKVATRKLTELSQRKYEIDLILEGDEELQAESGFEIANLHELLDGNWSAETVVHHLTSDGFTTNVKGVSV